MHVMTRYLDTRKAAIEALQDYSAMEHILANTETEIEQCRQDLVLPSSPRLDGMPGAKDPHAGESRLAATLDQIDLARERKAQAQQYMDWFLPAWATLTDDDRYVLETFFLTEGSREDAAVQVGEHFHIERTSAQAKKSRALSRFATALYGRL
ncbi:hypothetical protein ACUIAC_08970 [Dermabacteraceae bacterium P13138]